MLTVSSIGSQTGYGVQPTRVEAPTYLPSTGFSPQPYGFPLDSVDLSGEEEEDDTSLPAFFGASQSTLSLYPGGFAGAFQVPCSGFDSYPGSFDQIGLAAAFDLMSVANGTQEWAFDQGLANSALAGDSGSGRNRINSDQPLKVNVWPHNGSPVTHIQVEEVGDHDDEAQQNFWTDNRGEESATLYAAPREKQYYVTVQWADGSTYEDVVGDVGEFMVCQPN